MADPIVVVLAVAAIGMLCLGVGLVVSGWNAGGGVVERWHVQFERDEQTYVYHRTAGEMESILRERHHVRGRWPYSVQVLRGGELHNVDPRTL